MRIRYFIPFFFSLLLVFACSAPTKEQDKVIALPEFVDFQAPDKNPAELTLDLFPLANLSDYGFFKGVMRSLIPNEGVLLYEPASSLFTDYAFKSRYIWMPEGTAASIQADEEGTMDFSEGTVIIKNFFYPMDFRKPEEERRIIETRLMVKSNEQWEAYPYIWSDDQSDAQLKVIGGEKQVSWMDEKGQPQVINYIIPNKNQCKSCHNIHEQLVPIGLKAKHLNHAITFKDGTHNQLVKWADAGKLSNYSAVAIYPTMINYQDQNQSLELRARAYLDINCAHCHRAEAPASTSGLFLTYEETDPLRLGILKTPVAAGFGAGSFTYDIVPGKADESILTYRMGTNQVGAAMPEIGRVTVHQEGLELIKQWINAM
ncbi:SO2930 family diheme c-type cytochrome [Mongoliitalea lutea]|uniref:Repeat protein (TIGR03806 family) n=1 Tax=Mongoliitalea lutea TaxID=849756 RepID=A0A8J3CWC0_9BACT|nr:SO2930 family diheme c-type cytochrome [Mongoliitalea lutea]GHB35139.1 hypothetical protein GCM10008106_15660 [Mongoliitalea lutea]